MDSMDSSLQTTYTASELSAMITKSGTHTQALKSELEVNHEIAKIESKIKAKEERLKREQDFLDVERSYVLGKDGYAEKWRLDG